MMLKFHQRDFEVHEFNNIPGVTNVTSVPAYKARDIAQQIFDAWIKDNSHEVYSKTGCTPWYGANADMMTFKALIICKEPIEKCTHPKEKILVNPIPNPLSTWYFTCECGAKVQPKEFEEC